MSLFSRASSNFSLIGSLCFAAILLSVSDERVLASGVDSNGMQTITGVYVGEGAECPRFRLESGEIVSLSGVFDRDLTRGKVVELQGRWREISRCMQGREFAVSDIIDG